VTPWADPGAATFSNGKVLLNGARIESSLALYAGRSLEFAATFSGGAHEHAGFATSLAAAPWAIFSTYGGRGLWARTNPGEGPSIDTPLGGEWIGRAHRFRIEWLSKSVVYSIDGKEVARHASTIASRMRPLASDLHPTEGVLELDWMRLSPYAREGSFTSSVLDAEDGMVWTKISWSADEPDGTKVIVSVRSGSAPVPDRSWTPFTPIAAPGNTLIDAGRYLQYQLELSTSARAVTPAVHSVDIGRARSTASNAAR
jgi:hypothetical protein